MRTWKSKLNPCLIVIAASVAFSWTNESATAQRSLFESRDDSMVFLFQDLKARRVGDLLTVVVGESTDVNNQDQRANKKATSEDSSFGLNYGLGGALSSSAGNASGTQSANSNRKFDGNTSFSTDRSFSDRFTVQIIDVLPNGNMIISGSRIVNVEKDTRRLKVTGIIRSLDITADNAVNSRQIANLSLEYHGNGPEQSFSKQGWLSKRVNKIWPF